MPLYEYACEACRVIYRVRHGMNEAPPRTCQRCGGSVKRRFFAPYLNLDNFSSPTAARYAKMTPEEELAREKELQKGYETIWLPPPVKHNPWEDH